MPVRRDARTDNRAYGGLGCGDLYGYELGNQWRRKRDSNPRNPFEFNGFQDRRLKPLGHSSIRYRIGFHRVQSALPQLHGFEPTLTENWP